MKRLICSAFAFLCLAAFSFAQRPLNGSLDNAQSTFAELRDMDNDIEAFMRSNELKGLSVTVMKNDSLIFSKGYGYADKNTPMRPGTLLRIASVSKLITAAGIMVLQDRGMLNIRDRVFGPGGIIDDFDNVIIDHDIFSITVEDLLRHEGGFDESLCDPVFSSIRMQELYLLDKVPTKEDLVRCVLSERLAFYPGTSQSYSNIGYVMLSLVIEKVTGEPYEEWIQKNVLNPAGCYDMHIARNYYEDRYPGEARYYMPSGARTTRDFRNQSKMVERCYGGNNLPEASGAGAWVASTPELARFVASIDGRSEVPDIISPAALSEMICYFDRVTFSLGWVDTNPERGWVRTGTLAASHALVFYYPDGECWIVVTNSGHYRGPAFTSRYLKSLCDECRTNYSHLLPTRDLF